MNQKVLIIGGLILLIAVIGGILLAGNTPTGLFAATNSTAEIPIDGLLPMTGSMAVYGEVMKNGMELAIEQVNQEGKIKLKGNYTDTKADPKEALTALNNSSSCCTTAAGSGPILAEGPVADQKKILVMNLGAKSPSITKAGDYVFSVIPNSSYDEIYFAEYIKNTLKINKVAILEINNDYGAGTASAFSENFKALGGEIVSIEKYETDATDFKTQLIKIKEKNPEGLFIIGYKELGIAMKQIKELDIKTQLLASDAISSGGILELAGESANGLIYHTPIYDPTTTSEPTKSFVVAYTQKFGKAPDLYAANGYDTVMLYAKAIEKVGNNSEKIKQELYNTKNYNGVSGKITFDENGDVKKPSAIMQIQNQKTIRIE
ncbi:MAG: penicillin-binding protein activator [archaeon]|jgi:branched-chain amino acid transport system substrate-binding protein